VSELLKLAEQVERMIAGMEECDRLDRAAGEYRPGLTISEWVSRRMRAAALRARAEQGGE